MLIKTKFPRHRIDFSFKELCYFLKHLTSQDSIPTFENNFCEYLDIKRSVFIPSCRWGLYQVLQNLKLNVNDEVIMPAYTFEALPFAVLSSNARIKYVEPQKPHFNVDLEIIKNAVTSNTKVIIVSHLYGQSSDIQKIADFCNQQKIFLIEDCAHACGAKEEQKKLGTFGHVGLFSFGIGKNMNTLGGGMLVTNSITLADTIQDKVATLQQQSSGKIVLLAIKTYLMALLTGPLFTLFTFPIMKCVLQYKPNFFDDAVNETVNLNDFKMNILKSRKATAAQAALGILKLSKLESVRSALVERAKLYDEHLSKKIKWPFFENNRDSQSLSYYVIKSANTDQIRKALLEKGIDTKSCDMNNCASLTHHQDQSSFSMAEIIKNHIIEIPNHQNMKKHEILQIANEINLLIENSEV